MSHTRLVRGDELIVLRRAVAGLGQKVEIVLSAEGVAAELRVA